MSAVISASGSPAARIISRSILLRNWRMLPGQSCDCSTAIASGAIGRGGAPMSALTRSRKYSISAGMSSRRSASEGERIGTTERRWNRSSRKWPSVIAWARSRLVEEMMRTSTWTGVAPPTRLKLWSTQHAQDLGLRLGAACRRLRRDRACRHAPLRARRRGAAGPAPASTPNNSASMPSGVIAGALTTTNGASARAEWAWISARRQFLAGAGGAGDQHPRIGGPDALDQPAQVRHRRGGADERSARRPPCERNSLTSRRSRDVSSARSTTRISRSALNGFSMKS